MKVDTTSLLTGGTLWLMPGMSVLGRLRQEGSLEFKASLHYILNTWLAWATEWGLGLNTLSPTGAEHGDSTSLK